MNTLRRSERNITPLKKRKIILYLVFLFVVVQVAANIGGGISDPKLHKKIVAFKQSGVGKEINTNNYDVDGIIEFAESLLGTPHRMGGYSASGLDCSGLVKLAHAQFDVTLPHSSHEQGKYGKIILPDEELRRGDLVFFHSTYETHSNPPINYTLFFHCAGNSFLSSVTL